jgi:hypothetical protein
MQNHVTVQVNYISLEQCKHKAKKKKHGAGGYSLIKAGSLLITLKKTIPQAPKTTKS